MIHIIDIDIESKVVGLVVVQFLTRRLSKFCIDMYCVIWNDAAGNSHRNAAMSVCAGNMNIIQHLHRVTIRHRPHYSTWSCKSQLAYRFKLPTEIHSVSNLAPDH